MELSESEGRMCSMVMEYMTGEVEQASITIETSDKSRLTVTANAKQQIVTITRKVSFYGLKDLSLI